MAHQVSLILRFTAIDDDGERYTLRVYGGSIDAETAGDPGGRIAGHRTILDDGDKAVTRIRKGEYRTLSGKRLHSDAPDAP